MPELSDRLNINVICVGMASRASLRRREEMSFKPEDLFVDILFMRVTTLLTDIGVKLPILELAFGGV